MRIVNRRSVVLSSFLSLNPSNHPLSLTETVKLIIHHCPATFRQAVQDSGGRFLYRGESTLDDHAAAATILSPDPDLLLPNTYANDDPDALLFFQCLDDLLSSTTTVTPSVGHIATSSKAVAARWGRPVSIWPLCPELSYLWPRSDDEMLLYPPNDCRLERFAIDTGLAKALAQGKEIMFAARCHHDPNYTATTRACSFLTCPSKYDEELRRILVQCEYGL